MEFPRHSKKQDAWPTDIGSVYLNSTASYHNMTQANFTSPRLQPIFVEASTNSKLTKDSEIDMLVRTISNEFKNSPIKSKPSLKIPVAALTQADPSYNFENQFSVISPMGTQPHFHSRVNIIRKQSNENSITGQTSLTYNSANKKQSQMMKVLENKIGKTTLYNGDLSAINTPKKILNFKE